MFLCPPAAPHRRSSPLRPGHAVSDFISQQIAFKAVIEQQAQEAAKQAKPELIQRPSSGGRLSSKRLSKASKHTSFVPPVPLIPLPPDERDEDEVDERGQRNEIHPVPVKPKGYQLRD